VPVAGPTASGARLYVWDEKDYLCGSVLRARARSRSTSCGGGAPEGLRSPMIHVNTHGSGRNDVWAAVSPEVAAVDVVFASGRRLHATTTAGERYRGRHAGSVRFFLIDGRWPRTDYPLYLRLLAADGSLLAAAEADSSFPDGPRHQTVVARGRLGEATWTLRAFTEPRLGSLPGAEERLVRARCLSFRARGRGPFPQGGGSECDLPDYPQLPLLGLDRTCGPIGIQAFGLLRPGARIVAELGDGSRVRPRTFSLPRRFGGMRAFALPLPPTVALRKLIRIEEGHREVELGGVGPGVADCPDTLSSYGFYFAFSFELPKPVPEPALELRDEGVLLCATLGRPDPERYDCGRPPLDPDDSWVLSQATPQGTAVAGVVPAGVAAAEVGFADGGVQVVPTAPHGTYTGRYRDYVRVFSLSVPGEHQIGTVRLHGGDGKRLATVDTYRPPEFERKPRTVLRSASGWQIVAGRVRYFGERRTYRFSCLELVRGKPSDNPNACLPGTIKSAQVSCGPKRTVVYGQVAAATRRVELQTTAGTFPARMESLRRVGLSGRVFLAELPPHAGLRRVLIHRERVRRIYTQLPPPARQCGYSESLD
jgi:hypothetical protein